jgi:Flp pilus assembly protein TadG
MKPHASKSRHRWGSRAGNAMVEFALGSTILVTIFTGAFQYGYIFYQYNALENAVMNGARFASQYKYTSLTSTPTSAFTTAVQNMVVYGDPTGTNTTPVAKGLTTGNVNLTVGMLGSGTALVPISVSVSISGFTIDAVMGTFACNGKPTVTYAYQGIFAPEP